MSRTLKLVASAAILAATFAMPAVANHLHDGKQHDHSVAGAAEDHVDVGDLEVSDARVKAMLPGQEVAGGYLTIENNGKTDDVLVSITTTTSPDVQIHEMSMQGEIMKMRQIKGGLPIKAGETVELQPGGFHLMFMGVKTPLRTGESVKATLTFEKAGKVEITFPVVDPGKGGSGHKHG